MSGVSHLFTIDEIIDSSEERSLDTSWTRASLMRIRTCCRQSSTCRWSRSIYQTPNSSSLCENEYFSEHQVNSGSDKYFEKRLELGLMFAILFTCSKFGRISQFCCSHFFSAETIAKRVLLENTPLLRIAGKRQQWSLSLSLAFSWQLERFSFRTWGLIYQINQKMQLQHTRWLFKLVQ